VHRPRGYAALATSTLRALCLARGLHSTGERNDLLHELAQRVHGVSSSTPPSQQPRKERAYAVSTPTPPSQPPRKTRDPKALQTLVTSMKERPPKRSCARFSRNQSSPQGTTSHMASDTCMISQPDKAVDIKSWATISPNIAQTKHHSSTDTAVTPAPSSDKRPIATNSDDPVKKVLEQAARLAREVDEVQQQFRQSKNSVEKEQADALLNDIIGLSGQWQSTRTDRMWHRNRRRYYRRFELRASAQTSMLAVPLSLILVWIIW